MFMDCRDDHIGIVVKQWNHLFWRRVSDTGETSQIAEPNDGVDSLRNAAYNSPAEHALTGIAAKISFHQRSDHARERYRFKGKSQVRYDALKRSNLIVRKSIRVPC